MTDEMNGVSGSGTEKQGPPPLPDIHERNRGLNAAESRVKRADEIYCRSCGRLIQIKALSCPYCGRKQKSDGMGCLPLAAIALGIGFFLLVITGMLAAIIIPQFSAYKTRATEESVKAELREVYRAEQEYYSDNEQFTDNADELNYIEKPNISVEIVKVEGDCFYAKSEIKHLKKIFYIDCDGVITEEEGMKENQRP